MNCPPNPRENLQDEAWILANEGGERANREITEKATIRQSFQDGGACLGTQANPVLAERESASFRVISMSYEAVANPIPVSISVPDLDWAGISRTSTRLPQPPGPAAKFRLRDRLGEI